MRWEPAFAVVALAGLLLAGTILFGVIEVPGGAP